MEFTAKLNYANLAAEGAPGAGPDQGPPRGSGTEHAAVRQEGYRAGDLKLLRSAVENANYLSAEKGLDVDVDHLYVKSAIANDGPRMKRIRPAPMGRAYRYQRRMAHVEIEVDEKVSGNERPSVADGWRRRPAKSAAKKEDRKPLLKKAAPRRVRDKKKGPAKRPAKKKRGCIPRRGAVDQTRAAEAAR